MLLKMGIENQCAQRRFPNSFPVVGLFSVLICLMYIVCLWSTYIVLFCEMSTSKTNMISLTTSLQGKPALAHRTSPRVYIVGQYERHCLAAEQEKTEARTKGERDKERERGNRLSAECTETVGRGDCSVPFNCRSLILLDCTALFT